MTQEYLGVDQAQQAFGQSDRLFPRLRLEAGDRAQFYCITSGKDNLMGGGRFHEFGEGREFRSYICLDSLGDGPCHYCESANLGTVRRKFSLWVWVDSIFHTGDNPDQQAEPWERVKTRENRILFKEKVEQAQLLQLSVGRNRSRFSMFQNATNQFGTLQLHKWQLTRIGADMNTEYELVPIKKEAIPEEIAALAKELPSIVEIFKGTLSASPTKAESIELEGEEYEELPVADIPSMDEGSDDPFGDGDASIRFE